MFTSSVHLYGQKCKSWFCPVCRVKKAISAQAFLFHNLEKFSVPQLLTLTVNPAYFVDGMQAYAKVREGKYIPKLLTYMKVKNWACIMEYQRNGMPHWHLLVDFSEMPRKWVKIVKGQILLSDCEVKGYHKVEHWFDYAKFRRKWNEWNLGQIVNVSKTRKGNSTPSGAIRYITKYLFKEPQGGYPEWVMLASNLKVFTHSWTLDLCKVKHDRQNSKKEEKEERQERERVANYIRVHECNRKTLLYRDGECIDIFPVGIDMINKLAVSCNEEPVKVKQLGDVVIKTITESLFEKLSEFFNDDVCRSEVEEYNFNELIKDLPQEAREFVLGA